MDRPVVWLDWSTFESDCRRWVSALGLTDWEVQVSYESLGRDCDSIRARAIMNWTQRSARIVLNSTVTQGPEVANLSAEQVALEEVLHVAFNALVNTAAHRGATDETTDAEEHALIRRLSRVLLGKPTDGGQVS